MVEVRASRLAAEALAAEHPVGDVTRVDVQAAGLPDTAVEARASRVAVEVLAAERPVGDVTRVDVQAAGLPDTAVEVRASRLSAEVLAGPDLEAEVTRVDVQAAGLPDTAVEVRASRMALEALARQGSAGPVSPLALSDDAHVFLHNWVSRAEMSTSFRTSVVHSPGTAAESRRGLSVKPLRSMKLEWMVCGGLGLEGLERLEVYLRRLTGGRFQVPIYMDQRELTVAHVAADSTISVDTTQARLFPGARVVIVQLDANNQVSSFSFHVIDTMTNSSLTFDSTLGSDVPAGSLLLPMMDCEVALDVQAEYETARLASVSLTVNEAPGASQLPALRSDTPTGASTYDDRPVWFEEPDWTDGITKGRKRYGSSSSDGRAPFVSTDGNRSRQYHQYRLTGKRDEMWNVLEFFETRRGRLRSFWHIDHDQYLRPANVDASGTFISVSEDTLDFADFQEEFDYVGIVMSDGEVFVRGVDNIQDILTVYRITMDVAIAAGYSASDVVRVARARPTRFDSDEFTEVWTHTGYMQCEVSMIEALNEGSIST